VAGLWSGALHQLPLYTFMAHKEKKLPLLSADLSVAFTAEKIMASKRNFTLTWQKFVNLNMFTFSSMALPRVVSWGSKN
jgi:hypothetical protein